MVSIQKLLKWRWFFLSTLIIGVLWWAVFPRSFYSAWLSSDQQAYLALNQQQFKQAAVHYQDLNEQELQEQDLKKQGFKKQEYQAYAHYLAGDFVEAAQLLQQQPSLSSQGKILLANAYTQSMALDKAKSLYKELATDSSFSEVAKNNLVVIEQAIEKMKMAPESGETEKRIDDREVDIEETENDETNATPTLTGDDLWLEQVKQDPSTFLRQKFQQEYSNDQQ